MQNQWEPWVCFPATRWSLLGLMGDSNTQGVLLMSSPLRDLVLVAVTAENPASQRQDFGNRSRLFSAFVATSGYSALTLIQNVWRVKVVSNILLRPPSFAISSNWSPLLAWTKSIHLAYSQMGRRSIPSQFQGLLWWGSNAQTLLKAEIGDHAPTGRKKALAQSLWESNAAADLTGGGAQAVMRAMGSGCKYRWSSAHSPVTRLLLCGPVPNRPQTSTSPWPGGWGPLF